MHASIRSHANCFQCWRNSWNCVGCCCSCSDHRHLSSCYVLRALVYFCPGICQLYKACFRNRPGDKRDATYSNKDDDQVVTTGKYVFILDYNPEHIREWPAPNTAEFLQPCSATSPSRAKVHCKHFFHSSLCESRICDFFSFVSLYVCSCLPYNTVLKTINTW